MLLSVLVISRTENLLNQLLKSFSKATSLSKENVEILCSWNGSKDNALKIVNNSGYNFKIVQRNKYNFARNMNSLAKKASGQIFLIINDDIILDHKSIDAGINALNSSSKIGIVAGNLRFKNGSIQHIGSSFTEENMSYNKFKKSSISIPYLLSNINNILSAATGAILLIKKDLFKEIGFNEKYYRSCEDIELSLDVREKKDLDIFLCKEMSGIHFQSVTNNKNTMKSIHIEKDWQRLQKRRLKFINNASKRQLLIELEDLQNQIKLYRIMDKENRLKNPIKILKRMISKI